MAAILSRPQCINWLYSAAGKIWNFHIFRMALCQKLLCVTILIIACENLLSGSVASAELDPKDVTTTALGTVDTLLSEAEKYVKQQQEILEKTKDLSQDATKKLGKLISAANKISTFMSVMSAASIVANVIFAFFLGGDPYKGIYERLDKVRLKCMLWLFWYLYIAPNLKMRLYTIGLYHAVALWHDPFSPHYDDDDDDNRNDNNDDGGGDNDNDDNIKIMIIIIITMIMTMMIMIIVMIIIIIIITLIIIIVIIMIIMIIIKMIMMMMMMMMVIIIMIMIVIIIITITITIIY